MKHIEARYYSSSKVEAKDITDCGFVRFSFENGGHIDVNLEDNSIRIIGDKEIKIVPKGGCNHVCISLND